MVWKESKAMQVQILKDCARVCLCALCKKNLFMAGRDVYIVECVRSPLGKGRKNGSLAGIRPVDLLAETLTEVVKRAGLKIW